MQLHQKIFIIIIIILIVDYLLERFLDYLNIKNRKSELPEELKNIYNADEYKKQQKYENTNNKFALITSSFSFILILLMLFLNGFAFVDNFALNISANPILRALIFFGILFFASDILNTPFALYDTFVIEEKFGFNKTSLKTFILDKLKSWLLTAILGGIILSVIVWFYMETGTMFWIYTWALISGFTLIMAMFYSNLIVPLFNKQKPLEDGELRSEIEKLSIKAGFKLDNIFVINGSKRSTKANAYFTGLGHKKRIVLYDTLINDLSTEEIVAVLSHEIGHYKLKHTLVGLALSIIQTGIMLFILSITINIPEMPEALGVNPPAFHISLVVFGMLYSPISLIIGMFMNHISRKNEYAADKFAKNIYNSKLLISALKKLTSKNLSNLTPHPVYVFFHFSHPTLLSRIKALQKN